MKRLFTVLAPRMRRPRPLHILKRLCPPGGLVKTGEPLLMASDGYTTFPLQAPTWGSVEWCCRPGDRLPEGAPLAVLDRAEGLPGPPDWLLQEVYMGGKAGEHLYETSEFKFDRWSKRVGESVEEGELLYSVEGDKTCVEIVADRSGMLAAIFCDEWDDVRPGELIARILVEPE